MPPGPPPPGMRQPTMTGGAPSGRSVPPPPPPPGPMGGGGYAPPMPPSMQQPPTMAQPPAPPAPYGSMTPAPAPMAPMPPAPAAGAGSPTLAAFYAGQRYVVNKDRFIIGRGKQSSDLTIKDPNVSRQHAMVEFLNGQYYMVDMGSTNGVEYNGQRIARLVSEPDNGIYDAMNKGLRLATGELIGFLNSDDTFASDDTIAQVARAASIGQPDAVFGDLVYVDPARSRPLVRSLVGGSVCRMAMSKHESHKAVPMDGRAAFATSRFSGRAGRPTSPISS